MKFSRRAIISGGIKAGAALPFAACAGSLAASVFSPVAQARQADSSDTALVEVPYYDKLDNKMIQCKICPKKCRVGDTERGFCGNKENHGGTYYTLAYGHPCSANVDPIEKKPLFHYLPGTKALSISEAGCNFDCKFCQNWQISQVRPEQVRGYDLTPDALAGYAVRSGSESIAYTYGEPVVFYKYMYDCAVAGRREGVRSVMISNGYINPEPMRALCKVLDAVKIDYKAHTEEYYAKTCLGHLEPVKNTLILLKDVGIWFELVYLLVPTLNGEPGEIREMADWLMENVGPDVPLHFSRFHPTYKLKNLQPTPLSMLETARNICMEHGMNYVYIGNVPGHPAESTYCPKCGNVVIGRYGYRITKNNLKDGRCASCGNSIPGVWK